MSFEWTVLNGLQALRTPFGDVFMPFISFFGNAGWLWIAAAVIMLCLPKTRKTGLVMAVALLFDGILCNLLIKPLVARPRPYEINTEILLLIKKPLEYSFPSGHSAASFAAAVSLCLQRSRWSVPALIMASLIAFSRLYLYVHYPTDVLGGILLGSLAAVLSFVLINYLSKRKAKQGGI